MLLVLLHNPLWTFQFFVVVKKEVKDVFIQLIAQQKNSVFPKLLVSVFPDISLFSRDISPILMGNRFLNWFPFLCNCLY